jgi:hypothetical protein
VKHHFPPHGDRHIALSAAVSSIIVKANAFRSFRVPHYVNLLFFWPKKTNKSPSVAVDEFILIKSIKIHVSLELQQGT